MTTFRISWGQRVLGLAVLAGVVLVLVMQHFDLPALTWGIVGVVGVAALVASVSNLGDRLHADETGLRSENVILRRLGLPHERAAAWSEITSALEIDRKTLVLSVDGQKRWVLDAYADGETLKRMLQDHGVPVEARARPKWRDVARGRGLPPS